ncbi:MAG: glycoside hydrolase family 127 protein [Clostridia bacterium]|nr:glycoside hydrolase family 127 protein [Clostridia bacterium]
MKKLVVTLFILLTLFILPGAAAASDDCVLSLSFEGHVDDASPAGNHGQLNRAGAFAEGVSGQALYLDGATWIDLGASGSLQPAQLTFSAWIRTDGKLTGEHMLTWFKPSGRYQGVGWYLSCLDDSTPLKLSVGPSAGQPMEIYVSGSREAFFPAGEWVHIAVTYDSDSHTAAIYRNGVAQPLQYINGVSKITGNDRDHKYIGFNSPGYGGGYVRLALDEMRIFSSVLKAEEIVGLYTAYGAEFDASQVVRSDISGLTLSRTSLKSNITLPSAGLSGSTITWASSNEAVLTAEGRITRPAAGESSEAVTLTATVTFGGYTMNKTFDMTVEALPVSAHLRDFSMGDVTLLNPYEQNAFTKEVAYLKSLDADRLLKGFCTIGGVPSASSLYGGWESSAIKGHTLGHYLTAVSQAYATSGDEALKAIADHIVSVLARCQNPDTGYLAAIPESHYIQIERGNTSGTWVPWYTMHKVLSGLVDAYELTGNPQALEVAAKLGDWVYSRTSAWSPATQATVLRVEYGGMNDVLYRLYRNTRSDKHLSAAHSFDEMSLFEALYNGRDVLNGKHANTTIPKIVGALQRYMVLGEDEAYYLTVAENFWDIVVSNHTYITGGNSEWEHFGEPGVLDAERTNCNCETCNTYNMLKLTRELFKITGSRKYADYYENTYINAILSSQNPETGMTTYFQPMATGFFKVYSSPASHFWCCTGSGMENFSKLDDSIYFKDDQAIYVVRYTSSEVVWAEKGLTLMQKTSIPETDAARFEVTVSTPVTADVVLRVPDWCPCTPTVRVNGELVEGKNVNGFIRLSREWHSGDTVDVTLPMNVVVHGLPDNDRAVAFKYGPVVLSANLGQNRMITGTTGVNVTVPSADSSIRDTLRVLDGAAEEWVANIADHLVRTGSDLEFMLRGTDRKLVFTPHYQQHTSRYGIYFRLQDDSDAGDESDAPVYTVIDSLPVANDQYEFSHNLQGSKTGTGMHMGLNYRHAEAGGWFSYDLAVEPGVDSLLHVSYFSGDAGRKFTLLVNGTVLENVVLKNVNPGDFYDVYYPIPAEMITDAQQITVTFRADQGGYAGGIFDKLSTVKPGE